MNKRITSLMLCFVMVFAMLATAVPAWAAPEDACTFTVRADKATANPGETITFTIYMRQVGVILGLEGTLKIPSGLTYVPNSGKTVDGIKTTLGWDAFDWTEESLFLNGYGSEDYTDTSEIALMTFQCTVNNDAAAQDYIVTFDEALAANQLGDPKEVTVNAATVTVTIPHTHVYDKEVATEGYLKTGATCTEAAVYYKSCECGAKGTETFTSGSALGHEYTKKVENNTYLKTAASNCTEYNVYWYACSRCDANAKDDAAATDKYYTSTTAGNHSFTEKIEDTAHYVAGTGTDCQSVKKYYYDCAYCDQIGTTTWDSTTYGEHNYAATWSSDADGHWHECSLCHGKKDEAAHTPDHEGHATEEYAIKCTECGWEIEAQVGHVHKMTEVKGKHATCTEAGNKAYYVCSGCSKWFADAEGKSEITDHDSVILNALGHNWADATCTAPKTCKGCDVTEGFALGHNYAREWSSDADGHWHACTRCGDKIDQEGHTPDRGEATETEPVLCTICGYEIAPVLTLDYTVKVIDGSGSGIYRAGSEVSVTAASKFGQVFDGWVVLEGNVVISNTKDKTITFTMPREDVVLAATYSSNILSNYLPRLYQVKITAGEGGTFSPRDLYRLAAGGDQLVQFIPNDGYEVADVMVNGVSIGAVEKYLILDIDRDTNIRVTFSKIINMPFHDVDKDDWFYEDVAYVYENNLMVGFSEVKFAPNVSANRAMIVTILWRLEGEPAAAAAGFVDVAADAWYADAVAWAAENGIVLGYGDSIFAPEDSITREQMLAILHRYAAYKGWDEVTSASMAAQYECSDWAENDVNWAELNGLLEGIEVDLSDMTKEASRAEIAAVLHAFCETIVK